MAEAINVMPDSYGVTREYMQLRLWEMLGIDLVGQAHLHPGQLEHLLNYVRVRQVEEMRMRMASI